MELSTIEVAEFSTIQREIAEIPGRLLFRLRFSDSSYKPYELILTKHEANKLLGLLHHSLNAKD